MGGKGQGVGVAAGVRQYGAGEREMGDVRVAAVGSHCSRDLEEEGGNVRSLVQQRSLRGVVHRVDSHAAAPVVEADNGPPVQRNTALVPRTLPLDGRSLPDPSAAPPTPEER